MSVRRAGLAHLHRHHLQFVGQIGHQRDELGELADQMRLQRVDFLVGVDRLAQARARARVKYGSRWVKSTSSIRARSLHQHPHALVGILEHLEDAHRGAAREQSLGRRIFLFGIFLRGERDDSRCLPDILDQA